MKKTPDHVAVLTGTSDSILHEALAAASLRAALSILGAAQRTEVRFLSFCIEAASQAQCAAEADLLAQRLHGEISEARNQGLSVQIRAQSGRRDIVEATRKLAAKVKSGRLHPDELTLEMLRQALPAVAFPDPDLIILCGRKASEQVAASWRLSDRLCFEGAYAEFYFCAAPFAEFAIADWHSALHDYGGRDRRFGRSTSSEALPAGRRTEAATISPENCIF